MAKRNKIYELPDELRADINRLLASKKLTIAELKKYIDSHKLNNGIEVSHSGLGRYKKEYDIMMKEFLALDHLVKNLPSEVNFNSENDLHQLLYKILSKSVLDNSMGKELKPSEIMLLARALKDLMSSTKDREKIKAELKKELQKETIAKVETVAKRSGLSKKAINLIKTALSE